MGQHKIKDGHLEFHYGYDERIREFWYQVIDNSKLHVNDGIVDDGGTISTNMPILVMAEKMKQFKASKSHIQKVLFFRKI